MSQAAGKVTVFERSVWPVRAVGSNMGPTVGRRLSPVLPGYGSSLLHHRTMVSVQPTSQFCGSRNGMYRELGYSPKVTQLATGRARIVLLVGLWRRASWEGREGMGESWVCVYACARARVWVCVCVCRETAFPSSELFLIQMEGVKVRVNKGLSNHFQVNHTVALSTIGESNYHFGVTYVGTKQLSPTEAFPVLVGDMDNSGSLNAQVIHQLGPGFRSKMAIQTQQSKFVNWQVDGEYRGSDFTAVVTLGNPDVLVGSGVLVAHYLQSITPCLALGGELVYHRRPGEEGTVMSLAGKYTLNNWLATITLGQAGMHATYYHKASDQLQVGVEFEASMRMQDTSVSFGYQLGLPKAHLLFKGTGLSPIADSGREGTQL
ncbi:mitochondrial import receptor subunit TOM40 homolog isoform X1 [Equus asinus]|uniref:mitochondrial import receptor subunit TOM40 homolog isoform X1 n=1 Tax=Equus asinus TaxID=9793 RepID=UPI0038F687A9